MASEVDICNRALQKLGAKRIVSLTEDSRNARECNASYEILRDEELSAHPWSFARARAQLAADAVSPAFGYANQFPKPVDFLSFSFPMEPPTQDGAGVPSGPFRKDWQIEGDKILTNDSAPLDVVYTRQIKDTTLFHPMFVEALASRLALELNEKINQSNTKRAALQFQYDDAVARARKVNAIDRPAQIPPEDTWVTARF
jgi:hypothetical protein